MKNTPAVASTQRNFKKRTEESSLIPTVPLGFFIVNVLFEGIFPLSKSLVGMCQ